jgi:hypothetical protein
LLSQLVIDTRTVGLSDHERGDQPPVDEGASDGGGKSSHWPASGTKVASKIELGRPEHRISGLARGWIAPEPAAESWAPQGECEDDDECVWFRPV